MLDSQEKNPYMVQTDNLANENLAFEARIVSSSTKTYAEALVKELPEPFSSATVTFFCSLFEELDDIFSASDPVKAPLDKKAMGISLAGNAMMVEDA